MTYNKKLFEFLQQFIQLTMIKHSEAQNDSDCNVQQEKCGRDFTI